MESDKTFKRYRLHVQKLGDNWADRQKYEQSRI